MDLNFTWGGRWGGSDYYHKDAARICVAVCGDGHLCVQCWAGLLVWVGEWVFFVHSRDLECQLGHTYPLLLLASFPLPFFYFNILPPSLPPPWLKPMRASVHSKKRSEPFLLLFSANQPRTTLPPLSRHHSLFYFTRTVLPDLLLFVPVVPISSYHCISVTYVKHFI